MRGTLNRHRFSVKYPDGTIHRFGCCDPHNDTGRKIIEKDGKFYLVSDPHGEGFASIKPKLLEPGTLVANGYYDKEHDEWKPPYAMGE